MPEKRRNWPILIVIMAILAIAVAGISAYVLTSRSTTVVTDGCKDNDGMLFCIIPTTNPNIVDAKITNNTGAKYTGKFTSTCTEPTIIIDGKSQDTLKACGQALTNVEINPGQSKAYQLFISEEFNTKSITVSSVWGKLFSGELQLQLP